MITDESESTDSIAVMFTMETCIIRTVRTKESSVFRAIVVSPNILPRIVIATLLQYKLGYKRYSRGPVVRYSQAQIYSVSKGGCTFLSAWSIASWTTPSLYFCRIDS